MLLILCSVRKVTDSDDSDRFEMRCKGLFRHLTQFISRVQTLLNLSMFAKAVVNIKVAAFYDHGVVAMHSSLSVLDVLCLLRCHSVRKV